MPSRWPTTGPVAGGTVVTVSGSEFANTATGYCLFGTFERSVISRIGSTVIACSSPAADASGMVSLEVAMNNQDFTTLLQTFTYQSTQCPNARLVPYFIAVICNTVFCTDDSSVMGVSPSNGPANRNVLVTVTGSEFVDSANLYCRFGSRSTQATFQTATLLECYTPPSDASVVFVEVTNNNQDYTASGVTFTFDCTLMFVCCFIF